MNAQQLDKNRIPAEIRRLAKRPDVRRSLCALQQFRVDDKIPAGLDTLLDMLEVAETRQARTLRS